MENQRGDKFEASAPSISRKTREDRDKPVVKAPHLGAAEGQVRSKGKSVSVPASTRIKSGHMGSQARDRSQTDTLPGGKPLLSKAGQKAASSAQAPHKAAAPHQPSPTRSTKPSHAATASPFSSRDKRSPEKASLEKCRSGKPLADRHDSGKLSKSQSARPSKPNHSSGGSSTDVKEKSRGGSVSKTLAAVKQRVERKTSPFSSKTKACPKATPSCVADPKTTDTVSSGILRKEKGLRDTTKDGYDTIASNPQQKGSGLSKRKTTRGKQANQSNPAPEYTASDQTSIRKNHSSESKTHRGVPASNHRTSTGSNSELSKQSLGDSLHPMCVSQGSNAVVTGTECAELVTEDADLLLTTEHRVVPVVEKTPEKEGDFIADNSSETGTNRHSSGNGKTQDVSDHAGEARDPTTAHRCHTELNKEDKEQTDTKRGERTTTTKRNEAAVFRPHEERSPQTEAAVTPEDRTLCSPPRNKPSSHASPVRESDPDSQPAVNTGSAGSGETCLNTSSTHVHSVQSSSREQVSPRSLQNLRDFWTASSPALVPSPRQSSDSCSVPDPQTEQGTGRRSSAEAEGRPAEGKKVRGDVPLRYFRDRRPSMVYFAPNKADDFPWLTWDYQIHPCQADLDPSNQQRLEAARDPNYILNLVLDVQEVIGRGQYGTVHLASLRPPRGHASSGSGLGSGVKEGAVDEEKEEEGGGSGQEAMALKKMVKAGEESTVHALAEHRALLLARDCPFIITLISCFQTKVAFYLLMELAEGGSLTETLRSVGRFPEPNVRFYGAQLLAALSFLHDKNILHRDLKLDNVLLDSAGYIRLCDFGLSIDRFTDHDQVCSPCGTLYYVAPEVLRGQPYSKTADWWSYGVLLYYMATGTLPFAGHNIQTLYIAVTRREPCYPSFLSPDVIFFMRKMLVKDPKRRPGQSAEQRQCLKDDPFFSSIDWSALHLRASVPPELPTHYLLSSRPSPLPSEKSAAAVAVLSASFPLDLDQVTPAERDRQSRQTRSRSLDPIGLFRSPLPEVDS